MSTNMNLLRGKLKERGVTQQELAQKIGMDSSTLSRNLEPIRQRMQVYLFALILAFLQVPFSKEVKKSPCFH